MMGPLLSQLHAQLQHDSNRAKAWGVFTLTAAFAALGLVSCCIVQEWHHGQHR